MKFPPAIGQSINQKTLNSKVIWRCSAGKYPAMQCHKDGCGSFTIQSGPFKMLYHGEYLSISNADIKIRGSSGDLR